MAKKKYTKLSDDELVSYVNAEYARCPGADSDLLQDQRVQAAYSIENRDTDRTIPTTQMSSVKMFYTSSVIKTLVAHQSRIFCSNKETVAFVPQMSNEQSQMAAKQLGMMVNTTLHQKNNGFKIITELMRSAASFKNGVVKVVWDEKPMTTVESLEGYDEITRELIAQQREAEGYEVDMKDDELRLTKMKGNVDIQAIAPEEFLINRDTTSINDCDLTRYVAHRKLMLRGDVQQMFPDIDCDELTVSSELGNNYEKDARGRWDGTYDGDEQGGMSSQTDTVEVVESWIRADRDGDGYPEWRHVFTSGSMMLMDEEWFGPIPFASFTFFPLAHKFYGMSVYDVIQDLEESATGLMRGAQDYLRISNAPRWTVKEDTVDLEDMANWKPGPVEVDQRFEAGDIAALPVPSGAGLSAVFPVFQELRQQVIAEVGIDPVSGQVSTDIEKSGNDAAKTAMAIDNASVKMEAYARMFADGALRDVLWLIAIELVKNKHSTFVQELTATLTPQVPFLAGEMGLDNILDKSDLKAKVGLGHQTPQQKIQAVGVVTDLMAKLTADPSQGMYNLAMNALEGLGYEDPIAVLGSIETWMQKAQQMQMAQMSQMQAQQMQAMQAQQAMQIEMERFQFERDLKLMEVQGKIDTDRLKADSDARLKSAQAEKAIAETVKTEAETAAVDNAAPENISISL